MKKSIPLIMMIFLILIPLSACSKNDTNPNPENTELALENNHNFLIPVYKEGKYGLINSEGSWLVEPEYDYAGYFSEGLAVVKKDDKYGVINKKGKVVIELKFKYIEDFSHGLAVAMADNDLYGFIDHKGAFKIEPKFEYAYTFSEGLAAVRLPEEESYSYIDINGDAKIKTKYERVGNFYDDRASVQMPNGGLGVTYGYIDKTGELVIIPKTDGQQQDLPIEDFSEGFGIMYIEKGGDKVTSVFVNKAGEILGNTEYNEVFFFSEGLAYADGGYIDSTGKYVLTTNDLPSGNYSFYPACFSEGIVAIVNNATEKYGFADKNGKIIIEPKYDAVLGGFRNGLVKVNLNGKSMYINKQAEIIWQSE